ncbi:diguanylate cyclase (GGDEF) domain-containing protein [Ruminococcus sp. YE71]|uniref:GGDEF domain-containing protein n=1 Tax=unclassified Ruminococcus TaxID=2608920 RepID=UPI00089127F6|nr:MULTISPECIES: GGDEF domain-containing protein [unclassified Ruminococcus]SDA24355.1 diguanylate cyclase (GGDEF) domain-containing protein [Ruminococcus sp. YE78]SFW41886.1 diguanylate cyclase (GGDEF) domain-containing protein [Ruminococcus sp. YE71]
MNDHRQEPITFSDLALALANDYSRLFVINAEDDSYIEYSHEGTKDELVPVKRGDNFFTDVRRNCREQVWHEDQEFFLDAFGKDAMTAALNNGRSFSMTYRLNIGGAPRYFFLKTIRANDRSIIIGIQDIDDQKRREIENDSERKTYSQIAGSLASLFEVIYHVDIVTGHYTEYSSSENFAKLGLDHGGDDFFKMAQNDVRNILHPDDREDLLNKIDRDVLIRSLNESGSVSLTYRHVLDGKTQYMNLLAFRNQCDNRHIVVSVRNIDDQMREEHIKETYSQIAGALASRYEVIYYINIENDAYTQYCASDNYAKLGTTKHGEDFFGDCVNDIKKYIHKYDVNRMLNSLKKKNVLYELEEKKAVTLTYRQLLENKYQYMNLIIIKPKNDTKHIIMGVFNVDSETRKAQSMQRESRTFSDISMALALQYEVIYHVNLITNEYSEYSASEKYTRLKVGTTGKDFFAESTENMKRDIYPEDLPMMLEGMKKENLLNNIVAGSGKTFLNYRLMLDGAPQYVSLYAVRPNEDSDHIIVAVANVDKAKRMELDYRNAVDMANRDALTGVKNKRAYAQTEMELDENIEQQKIKAFAVVICDINGLKEVNDNLGHKAGDDYIKSGCKIICDVFSHSPVFRIGGDEFAVIVRDRDFEHRAELMHRFTSIQNEQMKNGYVTLACGISDFEPDVDIRVQDVFERADSLMYKNKKKLKSKMYGT